MYFTPAQKEVLIKHLRAGCNSRKECAGWRANIAAELGGVDTARIDRWFCNNRGLVSDEGLAKHRATRQHHDERRQLPPTHPDDYHPTFPRQQQMAYGVSTPQYYATMGSPSTASGDLKRRGHESSASASQHWQQHDYISDKKPKLEHHVHARTQQQPARIMLPQLAPLSQQFKVEGGAPPRLLPGSSSAFPQTNVLRRFALPSMASMQSQSAMQQSPCQQQHTQHLPGMADATHQPQQLYPPSYGSTSYMSKHEPADNHTNPYPHHPPAPRLHGRAAVSPLFPSPSGGLPQLPPHHQQHVPLASQQQPHRRRHDDDKTDDAMVPVAKRARQSKATKKPPGETGSNIPEKRLARYRTVASQQTQDRIARAIHQRMFLIEKQVKSPLHQTFAVLGSTGNIYTVSIEFVPACTCPDFLKGNLCKHILFVYLKCLRVPATSPHVFQKALLTSELQEIFETASQADPTAVANARVVTHYRAALASGASPGTPDLGGVQQKSLEAADCPICFEALDDGRPVVWCKEQCGNNIHSECFGQWEKSRRATGVPLTCIYCRAKWPSPSSRGKARARDDQGYMNLAAVANLPRQRDTSTYRQQRSRWHRHDEHDFDDY
ncbi:hypothetical protein, variant 1 [Aphanomyces astaci]|uniref:SWIM-type domain-containing protein n=1 Tax=Aphanomyces astaci TaxID=112090 RepID=W4G7F7_APHAT|nr:hypothetical protein, variant 1 [Aphanomyces astaci]ETV75632.1 hypothetical protein, variant 1 [Aphanomyces astaci]|eukprot:XP_009834764.1 hypothetical protein, variant 1 [Aphanomyces astaci]